MRIGQRIGWSVLTGLLSLSAVVQAEDYYLTASQGGGLSWSTLTAWTNSAGANPISISGADDYDLNSFVARTPTGASPVFGGKSLTSSGGSILLKHTGTATITNLIDVGGAKLVVGNAAVTQAVHLVGFFLDGYTQLSAGSDRGVDVQIEGLTGSKTMRMGDGSSALGYYGLTITDAAGFTGTIQSTFGTTDWKNDADLSSATYEIVTAGYEDVILNSDITVKTLIIGGTEYDPGTYSFETLNAAHDSSFVDGGTGSITVLNESYHLTATTGSGQSWNTLNFWTNSAGASPVSIDTGDDYYSGGFTLRSPSGGGSFAANLNMNSVLAFVSPAAYSIQKLTATGGAEIFGFSGTVTVHVVEFEASTFFRTYSDAGKGLDFKVGTLTGGGTWADADNTSDLGYRGISITNGLAYTGMIQVAWSTTDFNNDVDIRNGTLSIATAGNGKVILDQDIVVGSLVIGDETYAPGTYSFADLNAAYDAQFADGGTGSIQVGFNEASFAGWLEGFPALSGPDADELADPDSDGMNNLIEYALGGIPTNSDAAAVAPSAFLKDVSGTNWFYYVYRRRLDAAERGLQYAVLAGDDLLNDLIDPTDEVDSAGIDGDFEIVSNRVSTASAQTFVRLKVTSDE